MDAVFAGLHIPAGLEDLGAAVLDDGRRAREVRGALTSWSKWSPRHNRFSKMDAYASSSSSVLEQ